MKNTALLGLVLAVFSTAGSSVPAELAKTTLIKVTSSAPGREIEFEGAFLFTGSDPSLHSIRQSTPYEARIDGPVGMGFFRRSKGDAQIVVEIRTIEHGKQVHSTRAMDDGVMFAHNLV